MLKLISVRFIIRSTTLNYNLSYTSRGFRIVRHSEFISLISVLFINNNLYKNFSGGFMAAILQSLGRTIIAGVVSEKKTFKTMCAAPSNLTM